jgi:hypothetical protein
MKLRPKMKTCFWPDRSVKNRGRSPQFLRSKNMEKPMRLPLLRCLSLQKIAGLASDFLEISRPKAGFYFWTLLS